MHWLSLLVRTRVLALATASLASILIPGVTLAQEDAPPGITAQPKAGTAGLGETFSFTVEATGTLPLHYQWRIGGEEIAGATSSTLVLTGLSHEQAGSYDVTITNNFGSVTSSLARLTIRDPKITMRPVGGIAGVGEDFAFNVVATGTQPLRYQWRIDGINIRGATTSSLELTELSKAWAGYYDVIVSNKVGRVTSRPVRLIVQDPFARRLATGRILLNGASQVAVPIVLRGNGRENALSFSLSYNANAFANPVFLPGYSIASVTLDRTEPGLVGVSIVFPPGTAFPAGYVTAGLLQFDLAAGANPLEGALAFPDNPFPLAATNAAGTRLHMSAAVQPQHVLVTSTPQLDRQSGLFKHRLIVANPGAAVMTNINVLPLTLGRDSLSNYIQFHNATATLGHLPYFDPLVQIGGDCGCGYVPEFPGVLCDFDNYLQCAATNSFALDSASTNINLTFAQVNHLAPGEARMLTLEYYVSDHFTVPKATYSLYLSDRLRLGLPDTRTPLAITTKRIINGTFAIEFPTRAGLHYYVQYASTPGFADARTAFPAIVGTGSRVQWIDEGPPKTISPPGSGPRFYRVFETP